MCRTKEKKNLYLYLYLLIKKRVTKKIKIKIFQLKTRKNRKRKYCFFPSSILNFIFRIKEEFLSQNPIFHIFLEIIFCETKKEKKVINSDIKK